MREKAIATTRFSVLLAFLLGAGFASGQVLTQIRDSGRRDNRINIVIFSEGYTSAELITKFPAQAQAKMAGLLSTEPFQEYASYINVFTIAVPSAQSGSDHPSRNQYRDTYFNSSYDSYGTARLLTIPPNDFDYRNENGIGKIYALLAQFVPDYDQALLIVNDPEYGGAGGLISIASVHEFSTEILIHEIGHTLGDLADEYEDAAPQAIPVEKPNATQQTTRELIKWRNWILPSTPIPTPETSLYLNVIGLFEGANYRPSGWFRPKEGCKMKQSRDYPFCEVCAEALVLNIYKRLSLSDSASPNPATGVSISTTQTKSFRVVSPKPASHAISAQWYLNNTLVQGATSDVVNLAGSGLPVGQHTLRVDLRDQTSFVRTDPANDLAESISWNLNVTPGTTATSLQPLNISTRLGVETGDNVLIGGFIITGTEPKKVIVRGLGPSLLDQGLSNALQDPALELFGSNGVSLFANDNWKESQQGEIEATGLAPGREAEAAILRTLAPGNYSAIVRGGNNATGIGLVEVYDLAQASNSKLANISSRGLVGINDNVMIGGFIIGDGSGAGARVIVRAVGPSLTGQGVTGALSDTTLGLHDSNGTLFASNDDWQSDQADDITGSKLQPSDPRESAILRILQPGSYTAIVRGKGGTTGVALVEVYNLGPK